MGHYFTNVKLLKHRLKISWSLEPQHGHESPFSDIFLLGLKGTHVKNEQNKQNHDLVQGSRSRQSAWALSTDPPATSCSIKAGVNDQVV